MQAPPKSKLPLYLGAGVAAFFVLSLVCIGVGIAIYQLVVVPASNFAALDEVNDADSVVLPTAIATPRFRELPPPDVDRSSDNLASDIQTNGNESNRTISEHAW